MRKSFGKRLAAMVVSVLMLVTVLGGCADSASGGNSVVTSDGKVQISFWHSMSGNNQEVLDQIVEGFNASQDQYVVNMANGAGSAHIIQIGEQNLQSMIDSGMIASISDLIEKYDFDDSDLLEQVVNFYTVNDTLYVMPFNCSSPVVYYNKGVFDAAGYTEFPSTFEGISEAAAAIAAQNDSITPVGMYAYGYALDQMVTNMGGYIINNENGRASRATEVSYQDQITQIYDWIKSLQDAGYLLNYGTDGTNTISGFTQQQIGMFIASSASARNVIDSSEFEVGIAPLPVPEGVEAQGVYAGGGALCAAAGMEVQAEWATGTGYFPICHGAYETETMQNTYAELPQLEVAAQQLLNSQVNSITAGPLLSQLPQLRTDLQSALEAVFNGSDVASAVEQAVSSTNSAITSANEGVAN